MSIAHLWTTIGIAILGVIAMGTILIVEHNRGDRRRHVMSQDEDRMSRQLALMRQECNQLRRTRQKKRKDKKKEKGNNSTISTTTCTEDYRSALDLDSSEEEFYDCSDEVRIITGKPIESMLLEIDKNLDSGKMEVIKETLVIVTNLIEEHPRRADLTWRGAKAHYHIAMTTLGSFNKQENIKEGIDMCSIGLKLDSNIAEIHKWYAMLVGLRSGFQSLKDRISDGHLFKRHIDIAIELNPSDPSLHHLLGRFAFEVAALKWYERKVAAALFGEPPAGTYQDALQHFLKAKNLSKSEWKENCMFIAKCHIAIDDYKDAITWLQKAHKIVCKDEIEQGFDAEIQMLLSKYSSYS